MPPSFSIARSVAAIAGSFASSTHDEGSRPAEPAFCLRGVFLRGAFVGILDRFLAAAMGPILSAVYESLLPRSRVLSGGWHRFGYEVEKHMALCSLAVAAGVVGVVALVK